LRLAPNKDEGSAAAVDPQPGGPSCKQERSIASGGTRSAPALPVAAPVKVSLMGSSTSVAMRSSLPLTNIQPTQRGHSSKRPGTAPGSKAEAATILPGLSPALPPGRIRRGS
jgi:hypothetical protein